MPKDKTVEDCGVLRAPEVKVSIDGSRQGETKEESLYRMVCFGFEHNPLLKEFQDTEELIDVALRLCIKRCVQIAFQKDVSPMHQVGATRLLAQMRYKGLSEDEGESGDKDVTSGMRERDIETIKHAVARAK